MSSSPVPAKSSATVENPLPPETDKPESASRGSARWKKYVTPLLVVVLALAVLITLTRNWNAWEGGKVEQETDDAYVRGDLTPLSTKVAGIVSNVEVADYQAVHKGDLIAQLEDKDYKAQVAQAVAAVEAGHAAIENNRRQRDLQDAKIDHALAAIDLAKAQIVAAQAGIEAVQADVVRTRAERARQEALLQTQSATQQKVEQAVADERRFSAQLASREADFEEAKTSLVSNELSVEAEKRTKSVLESQDLQLIADLHAKEAALEAAQVNLGYTRIEAPADGTVGERQVRQGQLVSPGTQVISFVPLSKWVLANYRETQLTNVKVGDPAEIRIDEYPGRVVQGKVLEISPASGSQFALLPPDNATGNFTKVVQRIPVKIVLDDTDFAAKLRPGLSVIATVRTRQ
ncbi:MAG TPA: HlyD family secretion protein [Candidatus Saccharimonadales bacterium]|jgi:membrane fusion protein (multidrug efflux system)|nr:HlyD family secretion protein [Candidatus Saccharimonadales bacterium]